MLVLCSPIEQDPRQLRRELIQAEGRTWYYEATNPILQIDTVATFIRGLLDFLHGVQQAGSTTGVECMSSEV